jgi:hypothetical protein
VELGLLVDAPLPPRRFGATKKALFSAAVRGGSGATGLGSVTPTTRLSSGRRRSPSFLDPGARAASGCEPSRMLCRWRCGVALRATPKAPANRARCGTIAFRPPGLSGAPDDGRFAAEERGEALVAATPTRIDPAASYQSKTGGRRFCRFTSV